MVLVTGKKHKRNSENAQQRKLCDEKKKWINKGRKKLQKNTVKYK